MSAIIIDGKQVAAEIRAEVAQKVAKLKENGKTACLAVILVGENPASVSYVTGKQKALAEVGMKDRSVHLPENTTEQELLNLIDELNKDETVHGILVQLPLPKHINEDKVIMAISPEKDVDGFHPVNVGNLSIGEDSFISCTPYGIIKMIEEYNIETEGKNAVILGRSNIVGKPLIQCMLNKNATVTVCHSRTKNIGEITKNADILIAAIGKPKFVKEDMVKPGAVVIDVGINRLEDGSIVGDVDFENVEKKTSFITPVPGGVGPMTIAMLLNNVVKSAKLSLN